MWTPELASNRLIGRTPTSLLMLTISAGYFLYDAAVSVLRYEGVAYLLHGVVSCCLYTYGALTGFLSYYGASPNTSAVPQTMSPATPGSPVSASWPSTSQYAGVHRRHPSGCPTHAGLLVYTIASQPCTVEVLRLAWR